MKQIHLQLFGIRKMLNRINLNPSSMISKMGLSFMLITLFFTACTSDYKNDAIPSSSAKSKTGNISVALPGGRANYVMTVMGKVSGQPYRWVRLARYTFTTAGTVTEQFNYWDQNFSGNSTNNKVVTGFTTSGCPRGSCAIKTPVGFQPSATPSSLSGTYAWDSLGNIKITWSGGSYETWGISNPSGKAYTKLTIINSNYGVSHGYGFGSTASFSTGANATQILSSGSLNNAVYWQNKNVGAADEQAASPTINLNQFVLCNATTIASPETQPNVCDRYHTYIAAPTTPNLRKSYWNHQVGAVACADVPGSTCISPQAGHTVALLQVIDDNGAFQGFVAGEASLHSMSTSCGGCAVIGSMYFLKP